MTRLAATAAALAVGLSSAYGAEPTLPAWSLYNYSTRSCQPLGTSPEALINEIGAKYRVMPEVRDEHDASGHLTSTLITVPLEGGEGQIMFWSVFRTPAGCANFAAMREVIDPDKYQ